MRRTQTVTFNVGGEKFQVARSLLDFYPDSVLAKSISERWQQPDQDANRGNLFRSLLSSAVSSSAGVSTEQEGSFANHGIEDGSTIRA
jgi:hypothetical protein